MLTVSSLAIEKGIRCADDVYAGSLDTGRGAAHHRDTMPKRLLGLGSLAMAMGLLAAACAGGGDVSPTPGTTMSASPAVTPDPTAVPTATDAPNPAALPITPPMEGPSRGPAATERTNYREVAEFELPSPASLPEPPEGAMGPEFQPPEDPQCPTDWQTLMRPGEGFLVCYPEDWSIEGHGYVSSGVEDRWYAVGLFLFDNDGVELAHVSIYVLNPYARPFTYTRDCEQAYRVTFAGEPAALCPDTPGEFPEAKIVAYHIRRGDRDYYVNVVPKFQYDAESGNYLDSWDEEAEATAVQIAHTFQFMAAAGP